MATDRSWDEAMRTEMEAWTILWEARTLLLSVPLARRKTLMENAIHEANEKNGYNTVYEQEVRSFLADVLVEE